MLTTHYWWRFFKAADGCVAILLCSNPRIKISCTLRVFCFYSSCIGIIHGTISEGRGWLNHWWSKSLKTVFCQHWIVMPTFLQALNDSLTNQKMRPLIFHQLSVILLLDKGDCPENLQIVYVIISVLVNLLCVWIVFCVIAQVSQVGYVRPKSKFT